MRKITFLALICIIATGLFAASVTIGNGSYAATAPINNDYNYSVSQQIYLNDELGDLVEGGTITAIAFQASSDISGSTFSTQGFNNLDIRIGTTPNSTFTSWFDPAELDISFTYDIGLESIPDRSWITITLPTPWQYNGTDNIVVQVVDLTPDKVTSPASRFRATNATTDNVSKYAYRDATSIDPTNNSSWPSINDVRRPDLRITYTDTVANYVTIGSGGTNSGTHAPVHHQYNTSVSQQIFLNSELGVLAEGGTITAISFQAHSANFTTESINNLNVRIGTTSNTTLTSWLDPQTLPITFTYDFTVQTVAAGDWLTIPLPTPWIYDGTDNIVIQVVDITTGSFSSPVHTFRTTGTSSSNTAKLSWSGGTINPENNTSWPSVQGIARPNLRLIYEGTIDGVDLAVNSITGPTILPNSDDIVITVVNLGSEPVIEETYGIYIYQVRPETSDVLIITIDGTHTFENTNESFDFHIDSDDYNASIINSSPITLKAVLVFYDITDQRPYNNSRSYEATPRPYAYDLRLASTVPVYFSEEEPLLIEVENNGWGNIPAQGYTIQILDGASSNEYHYISWTDAIPKGITVSYQIRPSEFNGQTATLTIGDPLSFTIQVLNSALATPEDDTTNNEATSTTRAFARVSEVGIENANITAAGYLPVSIVNYDSITQSIYRASDFSVNNRGMITHINYRYNRVASTQLPYAAIDIYMANASKPSGFTSITDWYPYNDLTLVKDNFSLAGAGIVTGINEIWIALDSPFLYTGDDLVILTHKEQGNSETNGNTADGYFQTATLAGSNISLQRSHDSGNYNVQDPTASSNGNSSLLDYKPQMRFAFTASEPSADLAITAFTGPAKVPGTTNMAITVTNIGAVQAEAQTYSIEIYRENALLGSIPALQTVVIEPDYDAHTYQITPETYHNWSFGEAGTATLKAILVINEGVEDASTENDYLTFTTIIRPPYDIAVTGFTGPAWLLDTTPMIITLENNGWTAITETDYEIAIKAGNITLTTSTPTVPIATTASATITIPAETVNGWNYGTLAGTFDYTVEITSTVSGDAPTNNTATFPSQILDNADYLAGVGIGHTDSNNSVPFEFNFRESLTQSIYRASDFGSVQAGYITHLNYRFRIAYAGNTDVAFPISIYMKNANMPDGFANTTDWVETGFTQVYTSPDMLADFRTLGQTMPLGTYEVWLTLNTPFLYTGDDLIVMGHKNATHFTGSPNVFYQTPNETEIMTVYKVNNTQDRYNPETPSLGVNDGPNTIRHNRPQMRFAFGFDGYGILSGNISEDDVTITQGAVSTTSATGGAYSIIINYSPDAPDLTFTKEGYITQTFTSSVFSEWQWIPAIAGFSTYTQDIEMLPLPLVDITGTVTFSDTGQPVECAIITIGLFASATTDNQGKYTISYDPIEGPFADETYAVSLDISAYPLYESYTTEIYIDPALVEEDLSGNDVFVFDIEIYEKMPAPLYATANILQNGERLVAWFNPISVVQDHSMLTEDQVTLGEAGENEYIAAHRFPLSYIDAHNLQGSYLTAVSFIPAEAINDYTLAIWQVDDLEDANINNPTYQQEITIELVAEDWNEVTLATPFEITETGLVVGIMTSGAHVMTLYGTELYDADGLGNLYFVNDTWTTIYQDHGGESSWAIKAVVVSPADHRSQNTRSFSNRFNVYVLGEDEYINGDDIAPINSTTPLAGTTFINTFTDNATYPPNAYRYAITAVHEGTNYPQVGGQAGNNYTISVPAYTNTLGGPTTIDVTFIVAIGGVEELEYLQGVTITANPGSIAGTTDTSGVATLALLPNTLYNFIVYRAGYQIGHFIGLYTDDATENVFLFAYDTIFTVEFTSELPSGWINEDSDEDTYMWKFSVEGPTPGSTAAYSESLFSGQCLTPDNWLITPAIELPSIAEELTLNYWAAPAGRANPYENLFVYITNTIAGDAPTSEDFITTQPISEVHFNTSNYNWLLSSAGIADYQGETVWIAFRHADSEDQGMVKLSGVSISATGLEYAISGKVFLSDAPSVPVTDATVTLEDANGVTFSVEWENDIFTFIVPSGIYTLTTSKAGYADIVQDVVVPSAGIDNLQVTLQKLYTVSGRIIRGDSPAPISGAIVALTNVDTPALSPAPITTDASGLFSFVVQPGTYSLTIQYSTYPLITHSEQVITDVDVPLGDINITSNTDLDLALPTVTTLRGNYPNPFNPSTIIAFDIAREGRVAIEIYNIRGQHVKTVASGVYGVGRYNVVWNGDDERGRGVGSGVYFYRMTTDGYTKTQKMLLMK